MSKGSTRRPTPVPTATVDANYERTFRVGPTIILTPREAFGTTWDGVPMGRPILLSVSQTDATSITFDATPSGRADAEG